MEAYPRRHSPIENAGSVVANCDRSEVANSAAFKSEVARPRRHDTTECNVPTFLLVGITVGFNDSFEEVLRNIGTPDFQEPRSSALNLAPPPFFVVSFEMKPGGTSNPNPNLRNPNCSHSCELAWTMTERPTLTIMAKWVYSSSQDKSPRPRKAPSVLLVSTAPPLHEG